MYEYDGGLVECLGNKLDDYIRRLKLGMITVGAISLSIIGVMLIV